MGKKRQEEQSGGAPLWMVTYGDLVTLLLTFFVLLLSFSQVAIEKFRSAMGSLQGALGISSTMASMTPTQNAIKFPQHESEGEYDFATTDEYFEEMGNLTEALTEMNLASEVSIVKDKDGIMIRIKSGLLFKSGSAEIAEHFEPALLAIAKLSDMSPGDILIEGHTDNAPIKTAQFPSNWELSGARSARIVRFFSEKANVKPERMKLIGYGEYKPIADNSSSEGKAQNRRVDIFLKRKKDDIANNQSKDTSGVSGSVSSLSVLTGADSGINDSKEKKQ